ncbi:MAG TPA: nodulation protein NfeD [Methanoregula sp.]|nr:nodulation protein NfeD [Methanoregula sp.]
MKGRPKLTVIPGVFFCCAILLSLSWTMPGIGAEMQGATRALGSNAAQVDLLRVEGAITPPVASFITESIGKSEERKARALLILLDTPGGLDTSMRQIVKGILDSPVPVIVYVYPSGARAASAGAIILLSAHIAAMAPGTNVGAAHPVSIGGGKADKEMMAKVVQDAQAYARSLAKMRGRNVEWAAKAVTQSVSITANEAADIRVIDVVAVSVEDLLSGIDGKIVEVKNRKVALRTKGTKTAEVEMPFKYRVLSYVSDPTIAYLLMMIGFFGILFEIYSPGAIFPGVLGAICIVLAFYSFQTIPINFAGLALIILGIIFFILELYVVSYGMLAIAGVAAIIIGSIMLVDLPSGWLAISRKAIAAVAMASILFFLGILSYALKSQSSKVRTGAEGLIGESGVARTAIDPTGKVVVHGEYWDAESDEPIREGERVTVTEVKGMRIRVKR